MTKQVKAKDNFVIVKEDNNSAADEVPTLSTDWWNYGGITRDVSIFELSTTFTQDYTLQLDKENDKLLKGSVQLNGAAKANNSVAISIPELRISKTFTTDTNGVVRFEIPVKKLQKWSDTSPKKTL